MKKLLAIAALAVAAAPSSAAAAQALAVHQDPAVPQLLVSGDRVELGYSTDSSGAKSLAGTVFVRTDLQHRFSPLALTGKGQTVSTILPARFLPAATSSSARTATSAPSERCSGALRFRRR